MAHRDAPTAYTSGWRAHALMEWLQTRNVEGVIDLTPGIRSLQIHYNNLVLPRARLLDLLVAAEGELGNLEDPYRELLEAFREISHGVFNPQSISDKFNLHHEKVTVKFSLAGKEHSRTLKIDGDWIDPDFFVFVEDVVKASRLEGKFYNLPGDGQVASVIFFDG